MDFPLDFKVKNIHTGAVGRVVRWLEEGMVVVEMDGDEIPAFVEDLVPAGSDEKSAPVFSKKETRKQAAQPLAAPPAVLKIMGGFAENRGLLLAFAPILMENGLVSRYRIWLVNDTADDALFQFSIKTRLEKTPPLDEKTTARTARFLSEISYDALNEQPEIQLELRRITTAGLDQPLLKNLKIRAKTFFGSLQPMPILETDAHVVMILENWNSASAQKIEGESLADFTKKLAKKPAARPPEAEHGAVRWFDLEEKAAFEPEIDLHIERLVADASRLTVPEILQIQLRRCDDFLERAHRLGLDQVFLIHGLGAGKLRDAIHARLRKRPEIAWFRNEFHKKYGYGATEVIFK